MVALTRSSSAANWHARWSVVLGLATLAVAPAAIAVAQRSPVTLIEATGAIAVLGAILGCWTIVLSRRARRRIEISLGRIGGEAMARVGKALGAVGIGIAAAAGLALGFYWLLTIFLG